MAHPVVWITRTADTAAGTARALAEIGADAVIAPVLKVVFLRPVIDPDSFDGVLFTSRNGVAAFCDAVSRRSVATWCVGDATARAAREAGFQTVVSADGDVRALTDVMIATADRQQRWLYAAPRHPTGDLSGALRQAGFTVTETCFYETQAVAPVFDATRLTHILIHSARAGQAVAALMKQRPGMVDIDRVVFVCVSQAAWQGVDRELADDKNISAGRLKHCISPFPDEASMLKLIA